jgi:hypothetical protein
MHEIPNKHSAHRREHGRKNGNKKQTARETLEKVGLD